MPDYEYEELPISTCFGALRSQLLLQFTEGPVIPQFWEVDSRVNKVSPTSLLTSLQGSSTVKAKATAVDTKLGISDKTTAASTTVNKSLKSFDEKYKVRSRFLEAFSHGSFTWQKIRTSFGRTRRRKMLLLPWFLPPSLLSY